MDSIDALLSSALGTTIPKKSFRYSISKDIPLPLAEHNQVALRTIVLQRNINNDGSICLQWTLALIICKEICHRDLKLENTLLNGSLSPRIKICDFGYSKSGLLHSQPSLLLGDQLTLPLRFYLGKNMMERLQIFVANPSKRITIAEIRKHPWFMKNMPKDLLEGEKTNYKNAWFDQSLQSAEEINQNIQEAKVPGEGSTTIGGPLDIGGSMDPDDEEFDLENESDYSGNHSAQI